MADKKMPYYNRELSWMDFNARVLEEATKRENPLMERLRFLAITGSNLDEFFMVRVAGVKAQVNSGYKPKDTFDLTPQELLKELEEKTHVFMEKQYSCLSRSIVPALEKQGICFLSCEEMDSQQLDYISQYFKEVLFPVLTPLAVDNSRPFPLLANKSLNLAVYLKSKEKEKKGDDKCFAIVQVPGILPRFLELPCEGVRAFTLLEDIIMHKLDELFELHDIKAACPFRVTRDSDMSIDEESEDFMSEMKKSIKRRKRGRPVRLELPAKCDKNLKSFLIDMLKIKKNEIYELAGPLDLTFLSKFAGIKGCENLCFKPISPVAPADFWGYDDIFAAIRDKDRMVHHPYESFDCVVKFIEQAAEDEDVLAIKQTLYRVSGNSPIIAALIKAAENGKQVTVLVELKARFDEENNINWAQKLEKAGCHVIYGLYGLKTHCKIALVVRREEDGICRYLHLGTGNYNDSTAKIYTDVGLFTCNPQYGADASSLFNVITGYSRPPEYQHFAVAPHGLRSFFRQRIQLETENAKKGLPCGITAKVNSLVDPEIIGLLYEASCAGVPVRLVVRGICCLIPGLPEVSENIKVISIVGQLLEHSRVFRFENAGNPKIYMGSADWMPRNLDRRVELVFPIEDEDLKQRAFYILETLLEDNTNARKMLPDKAYQHVTHRGRAALSAQQAFYKDAQERLKARQHVEHDSPLIPIHTAEEAT
ncbi:RNA degradosome polyphosphate kinase [Neglecta sp. X4]|uniref:RNA degradosome polyphosphate kinase n=1 Tax=unclassified Neglectibacter TaxID=2632164 RepID=UPI00136C22C2|nr:MULTISPECIES: RNA degradosome polyphosphate kinase [unclassified Neglectibacter]NBI16479.1 RNA degradosome polyphosphate kinase [Neglectibacter sp. 59]NBJ72654.1 RNA degradosome polyphosphate kinase [Neglectibacter sp. X4]NCE80366.1 RNA degradosome polyphosphate kinase [Neglectibacter sp. X58]